MPNLVIAGVGGQGVNVLSKVIAQCCVAVGWRCQFTVHKGGAQSLGSVYAELRVSIANDNSEFFNSAAIPRGKLDYLVALDPYEALRHLPLGHSRTQCWVEVAAAPLFMARGNQSQRVGLVNPEQSFQQLRQAGVIIKQRSYQQEAMSQYNHVRMANYIAGLDCLSALELIDVEHYRSLFNAAINQSVKREASLKNEIGNFV